MNLPENEPLAFKTINVIASVAFKEPYLQTINEYQKNTNVIVKTLWVPTAQILNRIQSGEFSDLIIMARSGIDYLTNLGFAKKNSIQDYVKSGIGVGISKGTSIPFLNSVNDLKLMVLSAKSIAYSTGPSGVHMATLFEKMGISSMVNDKLKITLGEPAGLSVERGEVEIAFQQISEILGVKGIVYVGPLPPEIQCETIFSFGIHRNTKNFNDVVDLINTLKSEKARPLIKKYGLEPAW